MADKKITALKRAVSLEAEIKNEIAKLKKKFDDNFLNAFEWSGKEMCILQLNQKSIARFISFAKSNPDRVEEWLIHNIQSCKDYLINGSYLNTSSNDLANKVQHYEAMSKKIMCAEYESLLSLV